MNTIKLNYFYLITLISFVTSSVFSQDRVITTGVPFLLITPDARAAGMGDIGVASSADEFSQQWNPAKYPFIQNNEGLQ